jgi:protein involved in ribonucleotide reduction
MCHSVRVKSKHRGYGTMKRAVRIYLAIPMLVMFMAMLSAKQVWAASSMDGWTKTYGGNGEDVAFDLVHTNDGGYALAGVTNSSGAGNYDFWLVKTDSSGNMQWNRPYGGTGNDVASALVQTTDGGYALAGTTDSFGAGSDDFLLVKTDASGNMQWNKTYGGTGNDVASALVQTSDGGYALAGSTNSFGVGSDDFLLVKTDSSGNMQWNRPYGGTGNDVASALVQTSDGGYALAGSTNSSGAGNYDFWLVKTDASGVMQWNETYKGANDDEAYALVQTTDGGYALAGYTYSLGAGNNDFWLVKTDASGNMEWNKAYGGTGSDWASALVQTSDGGYALAGTTYSFGTGKADFWLVKTDASGVVPEFPSTIFLAVLVAVTSLTAILTKRKSQD